MFGNLDIQTLLIRILVLTFSLSFHEYAHARAAFALGDNTAAARGRLTLNPIYHLDPLGSLAFIFAGIGWAKPVPINPANFDRKHTIKKGIVISSVAGPMANLLIAFVSQFFLQLIAFILMLNQTAVLSKTMSTLIALLINILLAFYYSNIGLAVFNLLPVPPLDGYKVFGSFLPDKVYYRIMQYERYIGMVFVFMVIFLGQYIGYALRYLAVPFNYILAKPWELIFKALYSLFG